MLDNAMLFIKVKYEDMKSIVNKSNYYKKENKRKDIQLKQLEYENKKLRDIIEELTDG